MSEDLGGLTRREFLKWAGLGAAVAIAPSIALAEEPDEKLSRIIFSYYSSTPPVYMDLYTMDITGKDKKELTKSLYQDVFPVCSPDGKMIAFQSSRTGIRDIYLMNSDGSEMRALAFSTGFDCHPAWSPDGTQIAFDSNRKGQYDIYTINVDGTGLQQLTQHEGIHRFPHWSPLREEIAFCSWEGRSYSIYTMDPYGDNITRLTDDRYNDFHPRFSPKNGKQIAFHSNRDGKPQVHVIGSDGSNPTRVTLDGKLATRHANWSLDGKQLVCEGNYREFIDWIATDVYVTNIDGSDMKKLAQGFSPSFFPKVS